MKRVHWILVVLIAIELGMLGVTLKRRVARQTTLPSVDWSEIRELERKVVTGKSETWARLAAAYRTFGLFPQAEYCYRQVHRLSPGDRGYLYYWAECFDLMGQTAEASKLYRQIIDEKLTAPLGDQTVSYCWLNIGQDRLREENLPAAIDALKKAQGIPKAKFLLSRLLIRSGKSDQAVVLLDQLLRDHPQVGEYHQMKSWAEAELGNTDQAQDSYDRSLRAPQPISKWDPTYQEVLRRRKAMGSEAWHEKSRMLETQGQLAEAANWSRKAVDAFWAEDRVQQLAKLELLTGNPRQAVALAEDCVRRVGASAQTLDIIGVASANLGDYEKARRSWERAIEIEPTPNLFQKLAELSRMRGDSREVQRYQALEQYQLGKQAWLTNDLVTARAHLEKATSMFDGHAHSWFYLGETLRLLGDSSGAEAAYQRCLRINPDHGRALRGLERLKKSGRN